MTSPRTAVRTAAVLGATAALTFAGAGAASATTATSTLDGDTVSVTFALESGDIGDSCVAFITPTAGALELATAFAGADDASDLTSVLTALSAQEGFRALTTGDLIDSPLAVLVPLAKPSETLSATDVAPGIYTQVSVCLSDPTDPEINPFLLVGDPIEVITGSLGTMSSDGTMEMGSALLGGGEAGGELGLDALSSAMGGEAGGELNLDTLSAAGDTEN